MTGLSESLASPDAAGRSWACQVFPQLPYPPMWAEEARAFSDVDTADWAWKERGALKKRYRTTRHGPPVRKPLCKWQGGAEAQ